MIEGQKPLGFRPSFSLHWFILFLNRKRTYRIDQAVMVCEDAALVRSKLFVALESEDAQDIDYV